MEFHEASFIMPDTSPEDYLALVASIKAHGLLEPIVVLDGKILDGRHRWKACLELGVEADTVPFSSLNFEGDEADYVEAKHKRRNLTVEQRATVAVSTKAYKEKKYKERQKRKPTADFVRENFPEQKFSRSRDEAGAAVGITGRTVTKAEKVQELAPEVFQRMKQGAYGSVERAKRVAEMPEEKRAAIHDKMDSGMAAKDAEKQINKAANNYGDESDGDAWSTPAEYIELARKAMGTIDCDPASNAAAIPVVDATVAYTREDDGLSKEWIGNVWLNPPYSTPLIQQFVDKLIEEYDAGRTTQAILLVNNCTDTVWFHKLLSRFPVCIKAGRIKFWQPDRESFAARQGQVFFYLGDSLPSFVETFSEIGEVMVRAHV